MEGARAARPGAVFATFYWFWLFLGALCVDFSLVSFSKTFGILGVLAAQLGSSYLSLITISKRFFWVLPRPI